MQASRSRGLKADREAEARHPLPTAAAKPLYSEPHVRVPLGPPPSHLVIKELVKGTGPVAVAGDHIVVHDLGLLYKTGTKFESSWARGEPLSFVLGEGHVIPGWEKGIAGMRLYGRRELIIPPALAYGPQGHPPTIPANETLVFVVDVIND